MNSQLFVSKYQLALPDEAEMRAFIEARLREESPEKVGTPKAQAEITRKGVTPAKGRRTR